MNNRTLAIALVAVLALPTIVRTQGVPSGDRRLTDVAHLDLKYSPRTYATKDEWLKRAETLKKQVLASAGLLPMPPRQPIRAQIFGRIDRGDYTIEKVFFESLPGFYVTGNLYRPTKVQGRVPGVLCPHGHWAYGRLENTSLASIPARAANFARLGMVAFAYDMVGYNDSTAISHRFAPGHREGFDLAALWSVNLLGLQLWNSIRALDFLLTLDEVDPERIGSTGASGGGTQTFLHAAIDERVKVTAPVNMISSIMQGGSLCENAPNLRIDTNNMELGALTAPRPLLMVSATGDWTRNTLNVEYPAIRSIYQLFDADQHVHAIQVDAPHNYNQQSREAVYGWFAHYLLGQAGKAPLREKSTSTGSLPEMLVFYGRPRPENELSESALVTFLIDRGQRELTHAQPRDRESLVRFRESFGETLRYSLAAEYPSPASIAVTRSENPRVGAYEKHRGQAIVLSRQGFGDRVEVTSWVPGKSTQNAVTLVVTPTGEVQAGNLDPGRVINALLDSGRGVVLVKCFTPLGRPKNDFKFFTTYNRSDDANRVQDILTAIAYIRQQHPTAPLELAAFGRAGLWALLARGIAPRIDRMMIDADGFDTSRDETFLEALPIPGVRRAGDFATSVTIAPLTPLLIYNTQNRFRADRISDVYRLLGRAGDLRIDPTRLPDVELLSWLISKGP